MSRLGYQHFAQPTADPLDFTAYRACVTRVTHLGRSIIGPLFPGVLGMVGPL
jgi:hypothetical protein